MQLREEDVAGWSEERRRLAAEVTVRDLWDLLAWLALPYGAEPLFATTDWQGNSLDSGARLRDTWRAVLGESKTPPMPGAWAQCPECGHWELRAVLLDPCASCGHGKNDHHPNRDPLCSAGVAPCDCAAYEAISPQPADVLEVGT